MIPPPGESRREAVYPPLGLREPEPPERVFAAPLPFAFEPPELRARPLAEDLVPEPRERELADERRLEPPEDRAEDAFGFDPPPL